MSAQHLTKDIYVSRGRCCADIELKLCEHSADIVRTYISRYICPHNVRTISFFGFQLRESGLKIHKFCLKKSWPSATHRASRSVGLSQFPKGTGNYTSMLLSEHLLIFFLIFMYHDDVLGSILSGDSAQSLANKILSGYFNIFQLRYKVNILNAKHLMSHWIGPSFLS